MSPLSRLARRLGVKEREAWLFYLQVKELAKPDVAQIDTVVDCIERSAIKKPTPELVALILRLAKQSGEKTETESDGIQSNDKLSFDTRTGLNVGRRRKPPKKDGRKYRGAFGSGETNSPGVGALGHGHDTRDYTSRIERSPHGVLKTQKCAICDPEGFRRANGLD